jgi:hypothetical protein
MDKNTSDFHYTPENLQFIDEQKIRLAKYYLRNSEFVIKTNNKDAFKWLAAYDKSRPNVLNRDELGDVVFTAHLKLSGAFNMLMLEFSRDKLCKETILQIFKTINEQKLILQNDADKNS